MISTARLFGQLDAHDRGLLDRWAIGEDGSAAIRRSWIVVTQAGSAGVTIAAVLIPLPFNWWPREVSWRAAIALAGSHVVVQLVKRRINRARPASDITVIACPDEFSFPSGHATAVLAVTLSYAVAFPWLAAPLIAFGLLSGWSRVALGVHYPGDVVAGQALAAVTVFAVQWLR